jgi:hypothetical protein
MTIEECDAFEQKLKEKHPKMFAQNYGGVCVEPGWWPILESLCNQIHHHVEWKQAQKEKYGRGEGCPDVVVVQIKEKFGGLRFYYEGGDEHVSGMVRMAESWAARTCEECGHPGRSRNGSWIKTLCDEHHEARKARYNKK